MRVLYLTNAAQIGGANRSLLSLWEGLETHEVTAEATCPDDGPMVAACTQAGVPCHILEYTQPGWRNPLSSWRSTRRWSALLSKVDPDLVHANDFSNARSIALAAAHHRLPVVCHVQFHQGPDYLRWAFRHLPKPVAFIHNSGATRDLVEPTLRIACPQARQIIVFNCVSLRTFRPPETPRPDADPLRVGIFGNLIPIKGHQEFLTMARLLTDQGVLAEYWIAGEDIHTTGYRAQLESWTSELKLTDRVTFLGHRSDVPELMRQLDVLVCASHVEPFGINMIEGMACEVPVVGTRVGGIPEVIDDGVTGFLVPAKDAEKLTEAVATLLRDPQLRRSMGKAGRERVQQLFSLEKHTGDIVKLYHEILGTSPSAPAFAASHFAT